MFSFLGSSNNKNKDNNKATAASTSSKALGSAGAGAGGGGGGGAAADFGLDFGWTGDVEEGLPSMMDDVDVDDDVDLNDPALLVGSLSLYVWMGWDGWGSGWYRN